MISTTSLSHKIITDITLTRHQLKPPNLIIPIMKKRKICEICCVVDLLKAQ